MKIMSAALTLTAALITGTTVAQTTATPPGNELKRHEPPPQAYADCKGKKEGATVQHTTPEGVVPATCASSPKGLVARPNRPRPTGGDSAAPAPGDKSSPPRPAGDTQR